MDAKDLMIGDWYAFRGRPYQCTASDIASIAECEEKGAPTDISEIPLTPEILEKNGFKRTQENRWVWEEKYHSNVDIIHIDDCVMFDKEYPSEKNGGLQTGGMIGCMSERGRIYIEGEYVHDLQHALRLCGIDKEIGL